MSTWLFYPSSPFIMLLVMILGLLLFDRRDFSQTETSGEQSHQVWIFWYSLLTLLITFIWLLILYPTEPLISFSGHFIWDSSTAFFSLLLLMLSLFVFIYAYPALYQHSTYILHYYILALFSLLGMLVFITAGSLLVLYLGLAFMTVPLYAMAGLNQKPSTLQFEAIVKYMVINILAAILLLYGMVLLYSTTQNIRLSELIQPNNLTNPILLQIGIYLILIAFLCKLGAAPFHFWVPDVYQITPIATSLWIATIPKLAIVGVLTRLIVGNMAAMPVDWQTLLRLSGIFSVILGHMVALRQTNIRRLLGYSSIANMGLILISFTLLVNCSTIAVFYGISYSFTLAIIFGVLGGLSHIGIEVQSITDLRGLGHRVPNLALILLFALLMMSGLPPFIGFFAKFGLLYGLITTQQYKMAIFLVMMTAIGFYYYLNMIKVMYFEPYEADNVPMPTINHWIIGIFIIHLIAIVCFGLLPDIFMNYYERAIQALAK